MRSLVVAAALLLAVGCNKSKKEAVPAEVDVEWPDAAAFPPKVEPKREIDAAAQPESPDAGAPSMSTGSGG